MGSLTYFYLPIATVFSILCLIFRKIEAASFLFIVRTVGAILHMFINRSRYLIYI